MQSPYDSATVLLSIYSRENEKLYKGSLCIISYNYLWIYNHLIKNLSNKKRKPEEVTRNKWNHMVEFHVFY